MKNQMPGGNPYNEVRDTNALALGFLQVLVICSNGNLQCYLMIPTIACLFLIPRVVRISSYSQFMTLKFYALARVELNRPIRGFRIPDIRLVTSFLSLGFCFSLRYIYYWFWVRIELNGLGGRMDFQHIGRPTLLSSSLSFITVTNLTERRWNLNDGCSSYRAKWTHCWFSISELQARNILVMWCKGAGSGSCAHPVIRAKLEIYTHIQCTAS